MAYIVAIHDVSDPDRFWSAATDAMPNLPPGLALHATLPSGDGSRAVCLWEAESVDALRGVIDATVGDASRNEYFEVDPQHAGTRGLPTQPAATG
jgi:hypothetical protein